MNKREAPRVKKENMMKKKNNKFWMSKRLANEGYANIIALHPTFEFRFEQFEVISFFVIWFFVSS